jgi:hypothetical protein
MVKPLPLFICLLCVLLSACIAHPVDITKYAGQQPVFTVRNFFQGHIHGYGVLTDKNARLVNRLTTDVDVDWQGKDGLLKQVFVFTDGGKKTRQWCFHEIDEHHFSLISDFNDGTVAGAQYGNVMHMVYKIKLPSASNYYKKLHIPGDFWQSVNNSPEHAVYTLMTSGSIIGEVKAVEGLGKTSAAWLKIPKNIDIGEYCAQKDKEWRAQRAVVGSYTSFELDNWFFMVDKNVVIQETAVKEGRSKLGDLDVVLMHVIPAEAGMTARINPDQTKYSVTLSPTTSANTNSIYSK